MSGIDAVGATIIAAVVAGVFMLVVELVKRRTPSVDQEAEQEDTWRKELWDINRTLTADIVAREADLKETKKLLDEVQKQNSLLSYQNAQLLHEKAAWEVERADMAQKIKGLESDVFTLTRKIIQLERGAAAQEGH